MYLNYRYLHYVYKMRSTLKAHKGGKQYNHMKSLHRHEADRQTDRWTFLRDAMKKRILRKIIMTKDFYKFRE